MYTIPRMRDNHNSEISTPKIGILRALFKTEAVMIHRVFTKID